MKQFMDQDFLLTTETAKKLYHEHAKKMPIIDYHCHLIPQQIYEDKKFRNLADGNNLGAIEPELNERINRRALKRDNLKSRQPKAA